MREKRSPNPLDVVPTSPFLRHPVEPAEPPPPREPFEPRWSEKAKSQGDALFSYMAFQADLFETYMMLCQRAADWTPHRATIASPSYATRTRTRRYHLRGLYAKLAKLTLERYLAATPATDVDPLFIERPHYVLSAFKVRCVQEFNLMHYGSLEHFPP